METCGYSHSAGGEVVHRKNGSGSGTGLRKLSAALIAGVLMTALATTAFAELPAPVWMPNSPLLAGSQVIVLWLPVPGAAKYVIYMNDKKVGESASVQHIMAAPEESGEYRIQIASVDGAGKEGPKGPPGVIKIITVEPPKGLISRIAENKVLLRWDKAKGAVIYNVYRSEKKDGEYKLLASVQSEDTSDGTAQAGKVYYYAVTSKDLAGKESKKSEPMMVSLVQAKAAAEQVKLTLTVVPSREINKILLFGKNKVSMYGDFKIGPDGKGYMVDSGEARVIRIDLQSGDVEKVFGEAGIGEGKLKRPGKLAFAKDGRIFLGDINGKIVVYDAEGNFKYEIKMPVPDKGKDKEIFENALEASRGAVPIPNGLLVDEKSDTLYVASAIYNTIFTFTLDGKFKGYIGKGGSGEGLTLASPSEMFFDGNGDFVVTEPPAHSVAIIDLKEKKRKDTIGNRRTGFIGAFIGINGATLTPQGNYLFCDSGIHSIQVFDPKDHNYLYHIGGAEPMADPEFKDRAKFDFQYPVGGNFDAAGRLYVVNGLKRSISVREVLWDQAKKIE